MKYLFLFCSATMMLVFLSCGPGSAETKGLVSISEDSLIRRGSYLVTVAGCGDCHSPKVMTAMGPAPDTSRLFSGHRGDAAKMEVSADAFTKGWVLFNGENTSLSTPGFTSYSANITSDSSGIGAWTFEQFKTAMTKGKWKGQPNGRDLLPPMPWQNYASMTDDDLKAIFAFLRSTRPVRNIVPSPLLQ